MELAGSDIGHVAIRFARAHGNACQDSTADPYLTGPDELEYGLDFVAKFRVQE